MEATRQLQENNNQRKKSIKQDGAYKLTLLYRKSRDGEETKKFRELCNGKGPTIAVGKVSDTDEILGGYNPFAWGSEKNYNHNTKESFIFALDKTVDNCIVSFVVDSTYAIGDSSDWL